jgi:hypothetical protein
MNLSPSLQQAIEEIALSQGISTEQFIVQTLIEKISSIQQPALTDSKLQTGLVEKDGIWVFNTEAIDFADLNALIAQSRDDRDLEQMGL